MPPPAFRLFRRNLRGVAGTQVQSVVQGHFTASAKRLRAEHRRPTPYGDLTRSPVPGVIPEPVRVREDAPAARERLLTGPSAAGTAASGRRILGRRTLGAL